MVEIRGHYHINFDYLRYSFVWLNYGYLEGKSYWREDHNRTSDKYSNLPFYFLQEDIYSQVQHVVPLDFEVLRQGPL